MNTIGCIAIPSFEATGINGSSELTFAVAPPSDGSLALAFITLEPSFAHYVAGLVTQRLAYASGGPDDRNVPVQIVGGSQVNAYLPSGWSWA